MSNSETVRELCTICEMQNSIIRAQSDALGQLGAMVMEEEKAMVTGESIKLSDKNAGAGIDLAKYSTMLGG